MIKRVKIEGYKSLAEIEVPVKSLTVFFGPNAAGKSNLFDALHLLSGLAGKKSIKDALEDHRGTSIEMPTLPKSGSVEDGTPKRVVFEVDVELSRRATDYVEKRISEIREGTAKIKPPRPKWRRNLRYRLVLEIRTQRGLVLNVEECVSPLNRSGEPCRKTPYLSLKGNVIRLRREGKARPTEYETPLDRTVLSENHTPHHYPHVVALREELERWHFHYFNPYAMRRANPLADVRNIDADGANLAAFLYSLRLENEGRTEHCKSPCTN